MARSKIVDRAPDPRVRPGYSYLNNSHKVHPFSSFFLFFSYSYGRVTRRPLIRRWRCTAVRFENASVGVARMQYSSTGVRRSNRMPNPSRSAGFNFLSVFSNRLLLNSHELYRRQ